mmetsp:Transcript_10818/g.39670  ORF Transcript_10818/g.39670 Transcript_10818/m.39670 type:complete len:389 (-) Transcript_10818:743-1909(-)
MRTAVISTASQMRAHKTLTTSCELQWTRSAAPALRKALPGSGMQLAGTGCAYHARAAQRQQPTWKGVQGHGQRRCLSTFAQWAPTPLPAPPQHFEQYQNPGFKIVFVSAEVAPYSKTGGLGDVMASLPMALARQGFKVMVVSPKYMHYECAWPTDSVATIPLFGYNFDVGFSHERRSGVDWVFVDHRDTYMRPGTFYADLEGNAFPDNLFRFAMLSRAALEAPFVLPIMEDGTVYGDDCVFVANDWHAALVPIYLAAHYRRHGVYQNARCIMAIHNLMHQGLFARHEFEGLGLPEDWIGGLHWTNEDGECINLLKGGIVSADRVVTVSPGYANEILTEEFGFRLHELLQQRFHRLDGIVNGIPFRVELVPSMAVTPCLQLIDALECQG